MHLQDRAPGSIDFCVVRENTEGEYSEIGERVNVGTDAKAIMQTAVFSRRGCDRVMRYAFELASRRRGHVTSATKSNGLLHSMPYWDERFAEMAARYPDVRTDRYHIDILCAHLVRHPDWFDVIVASNLLGDILSDLGPAVVGSIGIAPSGNLNPEGEYPSMFEPVHGSAPDIAGRHVAQQADGQVHGHVDGLCGLVPCSGELHAQRALTFLLELPLGMSLEASRAVVHSNHFRGGCATLHKSREEHVRKVRQRVRTPVRRLAVLISDRDYGPANRADLHASSLMTNCYSLRLPPTTTARAMPRSRPPSRPIRRHRCARMI